MSKSAALKKARQLRAKGQAVRVLHHAGIYTQPGRGIAAYSYYSVNAR